MTKLFLKMMWTQSVYIAVIRHILTALGALLISHGTINADNWNTATGAILALAGLIWSMLNKAANPSPFTAANPGNPPTASPAK